MTFKEVSNKVDFVAQEHSILKFWDKSQALQKLRTLREGAPKWSFIDGPITANNPMGVHHGWGRTYKDLYNRYFAMRGHELRYQQGFDCQGLWVEVEVEKELEFNNKKDIEAYGLDKFILRCKERVLRFAAVQTEQSQRLGYWMEWNDPDKLRALGLQLLTDDSKEITYDGPAGELTATAEQVVGQLGMPELGGSYFTFSDENNYMIWAFLKKIWEKGWLYRGADSMPWCPRCATAISQHEIVTDGYVELTHDSVTLRFPLRGRDKESLLIWTTTPWTLTSNVVAAVGPDLDYVKVRQGDEILYLSKGTLGMLQGEHEVLETLKGADMQGWTYDGPFDELPASQMPGGKTELPKLIEGVKESAAEAHRVILWDDVGENEGTGIVHIAPGAGADDFRLGKENGLPLIAPLDEEGVILDDFGWLSGLSVADAAKPIFDDLDKKGLLYNVAPYQHRYPTCWRCQTELVFRTVDEWFINMGESYEKPREKLTKKQKDASLRYQIMDSVDQIRWVPEFGHAREMDWLRNMHDWMISKKRYWGLALPIWVCDDCEDHSVVGSEHELKERAVEGWEKFEGHAPHRPHIDAVKLACESCGGLMTRIPDVGNPWLDAGIVPFSTLRYRDDPDYWKKWYPADWISESFPGQFRNWFYSVLAMGTVMDGSPAFKSLFGYALLFAEDGREMHKSWGNMVEFNEAADKMGVDVMRWLYCNHKPENNLKFGYDRADAVRRRVLIPLWNVYSFLATYARLDEWTPTLKDFDPDHPEGPTPQSDNPLDRWILARLNQVVRRVTKALDDTDAFGATLAVEPLIDDLTNWYVRRSRRRFWRSEHDADKDAAYATLYHVLLKLVRLIAPFMPFVSEEIYQNLVVTQFDSSESSSELNPTGSSSQQNPSESSSDQNPPGSLENPNSRGKGTAFTSIHHGLWPLADDSAIDRALIEEMGLARQIASLGLSARGNVGLKVRQPLARALVYVEKASPSPSGPKGTARALVHVGSSDNVPAVENAQHSPSGPGGSPFAMAAILDIVKDELNVKDCIFVEDAGELVNYTLLPDNARLGPRFGADFPKLRAALSKLDAAEIKAKIDAGESVKLKVGKKKVELAADEILVNSAPAEGLAVAVEKGVTVAVDAELTPELKAEGLAREIVRRIQDMRKKADFNIEDRIRSYYQVEGELAEVFETWADYIKAETLSEELLKEKTPKNAYAESQKIDGVEVQMGVIRHAK